MPFLSRIPVNPLRSAAQRLIENPHIAHAAVLGGLARQPVDERVLWRLEAERHHAALLVLTQSRPSWAHLVEAAGWPGAEGGDPLVRDYQTLLDRVVAGREFAFRLRANTVTSTRRPDKVTRGQQHRLDGLRPRGVRVPERTAAHQIEWFRRHFPTWGVEIVRRGDGEPEQLRLSGRERQVFVKGGGDGMDGRRVVLQTATAEGLLRIIDPAAAAQALLLGCGPARAYGCGLLTLAPVRAGRG